MILESLLADIEFENTATVSRRVLEALAGRCGGKAGLLREVLERNARGDVGKLLGPFGVACEDPHIPRDLVAFILGTDLFTYYLRDEVKRKLRVEAVDLRIDSHRRRALEAVRLSLDDPKSFTNRLQTKVDWFWVAPAGELTDGTRACDLLRLLGKPLFEDAGPTGGRIPAGADLVVRVNLVADFVDRYGVHRPCLMDGAGFPWFLPNGREPGLRRGLTVQCNRAGGSVNGVSEWVCRGGDFESVVSNCQEQGLVRALEDVEPDYAGMIRLLRDRVLIHRVNDEANSVPD